MSRIRTIIMGAAGRDFHTLTPTIVTTISTMW